MRLVGPLVTVLALAGCGHPVQKKLEGTWRGEGVENFDDRDIPRVTGWAKSLRFSFDGSRMSVAIAAEEQRTGNYRVKAVHNADVVLAVAGPDGKEDITRLKLDDEHSMRWMVGSSRAIVLRREL